MSRHTFSPLRFAPLLFLGLVYGLTVAAPGIYNAQFLTERGLDARTIGEAFAYGSLASIVLLAILPSLLERLGARTTLLVLISLLGASAFVLGFSASPAFTFGAFLAFISGQIVIYSLLDLFIEARVGTTEGITGRVRGLYLMIVNLAFTISPFMAGWIISNVSFDHLYLFVASMAVPFFLFALLITRGFDDPRYPHITTRYIIRSVLGDRTVATVLAINFLLQLRYAIVVMYLALYLHTTLDFSYAAVGLMISIANIPFVLLQFPLGTFADRWFGEKELLVIGFLLTAAGGFLTTLVPTTSMVVMTSILALMFTGAAIIEIMSESYFFKHVKSRDDAHIVTFRMLIPLSYVVAPLFGGLIIATYALEHVFAAVATLCLLGVPLALSLKDTR